MKKINILFEDESLIVCHKEAGIAVQSKNIRQPDMEKLLLNELFNRGDKPEIYVVHRLDQPVEGVVVFAKTKEAASNLGAQFNGKQILKEYMAVVTGSFKEKEIHLEDYLLKNSKANYSKVVEAGTKNAKKASLDIIALSKNAKTQLIKIILYTGRHHQIRVQLANAGHPIECDTKYNPKYTNQMGIRQIALCAYSLSFFHPKSNEKKEFTVKPTAESFLDYSEEIGLLIK